MLRGSSPLLQRSVRSLAPTVEKLAGAPADLWTLDVDQYTESNIRRVLNFASELRSTLHASASDILVTKIMLGTLGCVPAFDNNFKKGLGVSTFGPKSLRLVSRFYEDNRARIDELRVPTLDFMDGHETRHLYTRAKVIDMVFFIAGS
jgi:hypothetical protein